MTFTLGIILLIAGIFYLLRDTWSGYVYAMILLGNAVNLTIFSIDGVNQNAFPFTNQSVQASDPLTQALVLTAIVISFATLCFIVSVLKKTYELEHE